MLKTLKITLILIVILFNIKNSIAQTSEIAKPKIETHGAVSITNNGLSFIPTFMLGKPATIFDLTVKKNRLSFEPQFRFAIQDAKPWSFIFWMRYKLINTEKFKMGIGAHPSTVFSNTKAIVNGVSKNLITVSRYFATEITPTYIVNKNLNFGVYYLYSHGLEYATRNTNFVTLNSNISNIKVGHDVFAKFSPQVYYLKMDSKEGFYTTATLALNKPKFPLGLAATINQKIKSSIPSKNCVWNATLIYSF